MKTFIAVLVLALSACTSSSSDIDEARKAVKRGLENPDSIEFRTAILIDNLGACVEIAGKIRMIGSGEAKSGIVVTRQRKAVASALNMNGSWSLLNALHDSVGQCEDAIKAAHNSLAGKGKTEQP